MGKRRARSRVKRPSRRIKVLKEAEKSAEEILEMRSVVRKIV